MSNEAIALNKKIYNATASLYELRHDEIFNPTEQTRIRDNLASIFSNLVTGAAAPHVLDFGSGTGNLTRHLLALGASVVASDVSEGCLRELRTVAGSIGCLDTVVLNGRDLSWASDDLFDMVVTYSVLHHVPDYLAAVKEFVRVVKPGGIIYIDHEVSPSYWDNDPKYLAYCSELDNSKLMGPTTSLQSLFDLIPQKGWLRRLRARLWLKRNRVIDEGDIHVHLHDHIEWDAIYDLLSPYCNILKMDDYLVCREPLLTAPVWERWRSKCVDIRQIVARKN